MNWLSTLDPATLHGRRVLLRAGVDVPGDDHHLTDTFRLKRLEPTIALLRQAGAITILIGHRQTGESLPSLQPLVEYFSASGTTYFAATLEAAAATAAAPGDLVIVENIRRWPGEVNNDPGFAAALARLGDIYINDAFSVSHRPQASIIGVPTLLPSVGGLELEQELRALGKAFDPVHPFVVVAGGAKISTKLPMLERLESQADAICVGGALAHPFLKAQGVDIRHSYCEDVPLGTLAGSPKLILPRELIWEGDAILDNDVREWLDHIEAAQLIIWNGPVGAVETGHTAGTRLLADAVARSHGYSIVGGGDTIAAITALGLTDLFDFVSTGGGAMLDYLATGTLPGIEALKK